MAYAESNDHVTDDVTWPRKVKRVWPFKVKWRHRSRDHSIAHMPFPRLVVLWNQASISNGFRDIQRQM